MIEVYPGASWSDEDVPVPLHQIPQQNSAETPVLLAPATTPGIEATGPSGRDGIADDDAGPAATESADAPDPWEASPPEQVQAKGGFAELLAWRPLPRWLSGIAALLLAALCALSFSLGWQRGSVVAAEALSQDPTRRLVISDTYTHATTDYG